MKPHLPFPRHTQTKFIRLNLHECRACWSCVAICPNGVIGKIDSPVHKHAHIDCAEQCRGCKKCVRACPNGAILYTLPAK